MCADKRSARSPAACASASASPVALLGNPKLIIVDEPTAGLDPEERVRFLNLLSEIGEESVVILSTHIVEDVEELCSRLAIIDRGEILLTSEPLRAIDELRGRIWRRTVTKDELTALEARLDGDLDEAARRTDHRARLGGASPGAEFDPVEPDMKDVYFSVMARRRCRSDGVGRMKLREIFRYEIEHRLRSPSTWIYAAFLFLIAFAMIHIDSDGSSPTHVNAASRLALLVDHGRHGWTAGVGGDLRRRGDSRSSRREWIRCSSHRRSERSTTSADDSSARSTINAVILMGIPIGHAVATMMPYLPRQAFGPFVVGAFVQTYLLFLLPNRPPHRRDSVRGRRTDTADGSGIPGGDRGVRRLCRRRESSSWQRSDEPPHRSARRTRAE